MKILIACEESQKVCKEFRKLGYEAFSCDILPCSGGHQEWHIKGDVLNFLGKNKYNNYEGWDMIIAFPPCTHLAVSGAKHFKDKIKDGRQQQGINFFMEFANCECDKVAIEQPVSIMSTKWRKPDQIIQPYEYGHKSRKKTCLWLKGLPKLKPTEIVEPNIITYKDGKTFSADYMECKRSKPGESSKSRSKTYQGIAKAMAEQWSNPKTIQKKLSDTK